MMNNTTATRRPHGANRATATFQGTTIEFFTWANNLIDVFIVAVEKFHAMGLREATVNNISVGVH